MKRYATGPLRGVLSALTLAALLLPGGNALAAGLPDPEELATRLKHVLADPAARQAALRSGAERVSFCTYCHGKDGNSVKSEIPKLAGQNAEYLFNQFEHFADGRRKNYVMQELAGNLTADDRINIAIYFASLPVRPVQADAALAGNGKVLYDSLCALCHGHDGHGQDEYPRLAGQNPEYLTRTLRAFRSEESKHADATMRQIAKSLTEQNVETVSAYAGSLP